MEYIVETENLAKQYKTKLAVDNVSIHVHKGDIYGLIGKNGAGKTSLMKLILGLTNPTNGKVKLFGNYDLEKGRMKIGSLIEAPGLYKNCTAYENMIRFSILYGADKNQIDSLLKKVGLGNTGAKKAGEFSLGMRQRLGIAIALLANPEVLILDEPINGLDPTGIKEIRDIILKLNNEGVTFIISSHLLDELAKIVTNYGIIADGKLAEEVSAEELKRRCTNYVKIVTDDNKQAEKLILKEFPEIKIELKNKEIHILSQLEKIAKINTLLVQNKISVSEISNSEGSFEEYFIERLGKWKMF